MNRLLLLLWGPLSRLMGTLIEAWNRAPIGQILIALGIIQVILISIRELLDVWDDLIDPLLDAILCDED